MERVYTEILNLYGNNQLVLLIKFLNSDKLGKQYQNTIFVGDVDTGSLYNFKLNPQRTALLLNGELADKVADNPDESNSVIFGKGFGVITDIQISPDDGYMYILNYDGTIYRIVPSSYRRCALAPIGTDQPRAQRNTFRAGL